VWCPNFALVFNVRYVQWVSAIDAWRAAAIATNGDPAATGPPLPRVFEGISTVSELNTLMGIKSCWHRVAVKAAPRETKS